MVALSSLTMLAVLAAPPAGQPVLLDFTASWCAPCRTMVQTVERLESKGYHVQKVDVDLQPQLAEQYGVRQIPCFVMVANDREIDRVVGPTSFARLERMFDLAKSSAATAPRSAGDVHRGGRGEVGWPDNRLKQPGAPGGAATAARTIERSLEGPRSAGAASTSRLEETDLRTRGPSPIERALAATVRLTIEDDQYYSYGTGTIIDARGEEALVLTCGHIFRDSKGKARVRVDLFTPDGHTPVPGKLLNYNLEKDVALVVIKPGRPVTPMRVAGVNSRPSPKDRVFTVGCDHGGDPSVEESHISAIDRYIGCRNIEVAGRPVQGRSGGGLFTNDGQLIGVCNASDPHYNEGMYAAIAEVHNILASIGQQRVFAEAEPVASNALPGPRLASPPAGAAVSAPEPATQPSWNRLTRDEQALADALQRHGQDAEVICIVRSRSQPSLKGELIILQSPSETFFSNLSREFTNQQIDARSTTSHTVPAAGWRSRGQ